MRFSGIYKIENIITKTLYIGRANNIEKRWSVHIKLLRKNKHYNRYLQNSWNKYGEYSFEFELLEKVDNKDTLISIEKYYINKHIGKNCFNISLDASGGVTGPALIGSLHPKYRKVSVFDLRMNFIEEISGLRETERKYNTRSILECCKGKIRQCKGYIFRYSDKLDIIYKEKTRRWKTKQAIQVTNIITNKLVGEYSTIFRASVETNISRDAISKVLSGKKKSYKNLSYVYKK